MRDRMMTPMFLAKLHPLSHRLVRATAACVLGLLFLGVGPAGVASAQETAPHNPPPAAIEGYNRGRALYQAGRYREAVVELERALSLDPTSPNLVYNVARVHELLGELDQATAFYEKYREMLPASETAERERVASTLLRLQGARTQVSSEPAGPPTDSLRNPEQAPSDTGRRSHGVADSVFWASAGSSAVALLVGAGAGVIALKAEQDVDSFIVGPDGTASEREDLVQRANRLALSSDVFLMVGVTFAVSSVLLYTLRERPVKSGARSNAGPTLGASASTHGVGVTLGGTL